MKSGDRVAVRDFFGNILKRVVVEADDRYVFVCSPSEWESALQEQREPTSVGFLHRFVVSHEVAA